MLSEAGLTTTLLFGATISGVVVRTCTRGRRLPSLNYPAARVTALLTILCSPLIGGTPRATARAWFRDAREHPSPDAGVVESSFAGALGIRLGGLTAYSHGIEERPVLGDGRIPQPADLRRAVELSAAVQLCATALLPAAAAGVRLLPARKAAS